MKESRIFYLSLPSVSQGSFGVVEVPKETKDNTHLRIKSSDIIFLADGSIAGDFVGLGIIQKLMKEEKSIGITCNPDDLPGLEGDGKGTPAGK